MNALKTIGRWVCIAAICTLSVACATPPTYDVILRGGTIYDGSGETPFTGDVAVDGDTIAAMGDLGKAKGVSEIDVNGMAVAPGFVNMLSWAVASLIEDGPFAKRNPPGRDPGSHGRRRLHGPVE